MPFMPLSITRDERRAFFLTDDEVREQQQERENRTRRGLPNEQRWGSRLDVSKFEAESRRIYREWRRSFGQGCAPEFALLPTVIQQVIQMRDITDGFRIRPGLWRPSGMGDVPDRGHRGTDILFTYLRSNCGISADKVRRLTRALRPVYA